MKDVNAFPRFLASILLLGLLLVSTQPLAVAQVAQDALSKNDVIKLLKGKVSPERIQQLVKQKGIEFPITSDTEDELRKAGATESLVALLRDLAPKSTTLIVTATPGGAQVFVDDELIARTSPQGRLKISTIAAGRHTVRVSLEGYREYETTVDLQVARPAEVSANLERNTQPSAIIAQPETRVPSTRLGATVTGSSDLSTSGKITIGFTVSKTGLLNVDSLEQYRGFELWRDEVNAAGDVRAGGKSYRIEFVSYDDESNVKAVQQLYSRMILQDNVDFLFSPYSSPLTASAAIVTEQYGKIMLTTGAAEGRTYTLGNRYLFQMFAPATEYLSSVLDALKTRDPNAPIAFVYEDASFSSAVVDPANAYARQVGMNVVFSEKYAPNTVDFSAIIDKVTASKATVLLGGGHYSDGAMLSRQLHGRRVDPWRTSRKPARTPAFIRCISRSTSKVAMGEVGKVGVRLTP